jgi:hypothetical protein
VGGACDCDWEVCCEFLAVLPLGVVSAASASGSGGSLEGSSCDGWLRLGVPLLRRDAGDDILAAVLLGMRLLFPKSESSRRKNENALQRVAGVSR